MWHQVTQEGGVFEHVCLMIVASFDLRLVLSKKFPAMVTTSVAVTLASAIHMYGCLEVFCDLPIFSYIFQTTDLVLYQTVSGLHYVSPCKEAADFGSFSCLLASSVFIPGQHLHLYFICIEKF